MTAPRRRRTADVARQEILEAAERRLAQSGPQGLRLQDVAADVGISHPAVLHHFGSREALVHAVIERAIVKLQEDLVRSLAETPQGDKPDTAALFERVYETLSDRGYGRLMAWLLLHGYDPFNETARQNWARIGEIAHGVRTKRFKGKRKPTYEDTMFGIVVSALSLFALSIAGEATLRVAGFGEDPDCQKRFRQWLSALMAKHMDEGM
ncbi:MAG TPA: TetR/AcrR family transcriptional regulator [Polyangiaceae bacterium]|jgi:AcrR family transcriptional regulator|nr:TetR/AcrR family transcriptional regulator [Polyangiaceae bacterium]